VLKLDDRQATCAECGRAYRLSEDDALARLNTGDVPQAA